MTKRGRSQKEGYGSQNSQTLSPNRSVLPLRLLMRMVTGARCEPDSQRASRSLLRDLNVGLLIELVRRAGSISRADLARQSLLSAATVSTIVDKLLERGILIEVSTAPSSGGRPPVLLSVDPKPDSFVDQTSGDGVTTVICDLAAQIVVTQELHVPLVGDSRLPFTPSR